MRLRIRVGPKVLAWLRIVSQMRPPQCVETRTALTYPGCCVVSRLTGFSPIVRHTISERSGGICEVQVACEGAPASTRHHRRPRGAGGTRRPETNQAANGVDICSADHDFVESNRQTALLYGWLVPQAKTPSEVPMYRRHEWVMLSDSGGYERIPEPNGGRVA